MQLLQVRYVRLQHAIDLIGLVLIPHDVVILRDAPGLQAAILQQHMGLVIAGEGDRHTQSVGVGAHAIRHRPLSSLPLRCFPSCGGIRSVSRQHHFGVVLLQPLHLQQVCGQGEHAVRQVHRVIRIEACGLRVLQVLFGQTLGIKLHQ